MTRCFSLSLVAFCTLCYGLSIFFNGGASSTPAQTLLVLGATRFLTLLLAALLLYHASGRPPALAFTLSRATLYPILTVLLGNAGMLAFVTLCALEAGEAGAGLVSGMVSLYMVLPVVWGIALRGERASARKLCGVALSLAATLLLGLAPASSGAPGLLAGAGAPLRLALLLAACGCWGGMDIASASLTRSAPPLQVALLSAVGQAITCALAALWALGSASASASAASSAAANTAKLVAGNALGVIGWLAFCQLGGEPGSEVSSFAPLISLYVFFPVAVELVALGGALAPLQAGGMALAVAGALCIALDWRGSGEGGSGAASGGSSGSGGQAAAAAAAVAAATANGGAVSPVAAASGLPLAGPAGACAAEQRGAGGGAAAVAGERRGAGGLASQGAGGAVDAGAIHVGEEEAGEHHPLSPRAQQARARAV